MERHQEQATYKRLATLVFAGFLAVGCSRGGGDDDVDAGGNPTPDGGGGNGGTPTTLQAKAVGAYGQVRTTCSSGSPMTGDALFLCPGGRVRGAGYIGNVTELMCGTYTTTAPSMSGCVDKVGCYPKIHASVRDTLILGGQKDVSTVNFDMLMNNEIAGSMVATGSVWRTVRCNDGSTGYVVLNGVANDVTSDYCVSDACPVSTGGGSGTCGTDCDCGHCWYCDKSGGAGTCRYGGEGPYGCYRGCG